MSENCANCQKAFKAVHYDYSGPGCKHVDMDGYICMAFADEHKAVWMTGISPDCCVCEMYAPGEENL